MASFVLFPKGTRVVVGDIIVLLIGGMLVEGMKGLIKEVVDVVEIQGVWSKETESLFGVLCG